MPGVRKADNDIICCTSAGKYDAAKVGLEDEKGKIPYFETHDLINMEKVRKGIVAKKTHAFIADINGRYGMTLTYNEFIGLVCAHGEIKKCII